MKQKRYRIKSSPNETAYFDILGEREDGFQVCITRNIDGYEKVSENFMDSNLFDWCLKTGFIREMAEANIVTGSFAETSVA
jgi:hypothetical protein